MAKNKKGNSSKRVRPEDIESPNGPASETRHVPTGTKHAVVSGSSKGAESLKGDMFAANINGGIVGGRNNTNTYNVNVNPRTQAEVPATLVQATAPSAFHNSAARGDPPKCHRNTRVAIQKKIMNWIRGLDPETKDYAVMWVYGPAGAGKTAIAQTIAETLYKMNMLLASFFFGRLDSSRNSSRRLIATIAYQIAMSIPDEVADRIYCAVNKDPHIFQLSLQAQIDFLLVKPLQPLIESGYFVDNCNERVVVIDGLDECEAREEQADILRSLSFALQEPQLPFLFLITSRPELEIKDAFNSSTLNSLSTRLGLADDYQADWDIKCFLVDEFREIKQTHILAKKLPTDWPTNEEIKHLVEKSSGQFIYASTVAKFVKSPRHRPDQRLHTVLGLRPPGKDLPFADLDALYHHIFSAVDDWEKVSLILAFCILRTDSSDFTVNAIEAVLGLEPGDCHLLLCDLGSIIDIQRSDSGAWGATCESEKLKFYHASLQDFLLDQTRSKEFYIDPATWHGELAWVLFRFFQNIRLLQWKAGGMDMVNPTILLPHIEQCPITNSQELEEILSFNVLQYFDHKFPPHVAYSIPDYLSGIKNLQFEGMTAIYQKQEHAFHEHLKKELRGYGKAPFIDFFLLCISENFFGVRGPVLQEGYDQSKSLLLFPPMHDSLWVAGWAGARPSYIQALTVAAQEIIFEQSERQTVTSAALYALKEASVILAQKRPAYGDVINSLERILRLT